MTLTNELVSNIPSYMLDIIASEILGDSAEVGRLAEGLSDTSRLEKMINEISDDERSIVLDLYILGGKAEWNVVSAINSCDPDELRKRLKSLGNRGLVFQGGLTGRDPLILLPSILPLIEKYVSEIHEPGENTCWQEPGDAGIWGHIAMLNTIRANRIRCRAGMEPFKKGWETLNAKLGCTLDVEKIFWELAGLGCVSNENGVLTLEEAPCGELAVGGEVSYRVWLFLDSCSRYNGLENTVFGVLGERGASRYWLERALSLYLESNFENIAPAAEIVPDLVDQWISAGILVTDAEKHWLIFEENVLSMLRSGERSSWPGDYCEELIIQPDMEILVPRELDPLDHLSVGEVADLVKADMVSIYRLSKKSVFRAVNSGWTEQKVRNFLDRVSRHAVPDNVLQTISGWFSCFSHAYLISGTFLVVSGDEKVPHGLEEVLPCIYRVPERCEKEVVEFMEKKGVLVSGAQEPRSETRGIRFPRALPLAARHRKTEKRSGKAEGIYPYGMVRPLPYGPRGESVFEDARRSGNSLIIFYPKKGYGEIQVRKICPVYVFRKGGSAFVEAFCEDSGEGEVFDIGKIRALFSPA